MQLIGYQFSNCRKKKRIFLFRLFFHILFSSLSPFFFSPPPLNKMSSSRPLRILALHGYRQNGAIFHDRMGSWRKQLKNIAQITCLNGGKVVKEGGEGGEGEERGWWASKDIEGEEDRKRYEGLGESLKMIEEVNEREGPFDGVLGFSQGAAMSALMCALVSSSSSSSSSSSCSSSSSSISLLGTENPPPLSPSSLPALRLNLKFAILVGGFIPRETQLYDAFFLPAHQHAQQQQQQQQQDEQQQQQPKIHIPSFHVYGEGDKIVSPEKSHDLSQVFLNPKIYTHKKGHFLPNDRECRDELVSFVKQFQE